MMNLPELFVKRMKELLNDEYDAFLKALAIEKPLRGLRINTNKICNEKFLNSFNTPFEKIPYDENYYFINHWWRLGNHPYFHAGAMYLQEPSAALPALATVVKEDFKVLDLCAAPGGKSSQILNKLRGGFLIANEINFHRAKILAGNIERLGYQNAIVTNNKPEDFLQDYANYFDLVMVDSPCSGEGMFRKDEDAIKNWSYNNILSCASRQIDILKVASQLVKPKGHIIYSTCTYAIEENEDVISKFLTNHPHFNLVKVSDEVLKNTTAAFGDLTNARRVWPHKNVGEGHFIALLERNDLNNYESSDFSFTSKVSNSTKKLLKAELDKVVKDLDYQDIFIINNNYHYIPFKVPPLNNLKVMLAGVKLGTFNKYRRFIIDHHLTHTFPLTRYKNVINYNLDSPEVSDYLAGYEISTDQKYNKEYVVIAVDQMALGLGKNVNDTIKNYYPKGLRNLVKNFEKY